jgi:hypothetical protein
MNGQRTHRNGPDDEPMEVMVRHGSFGVTLIDICKQWPINR